MFDVFNYEKRYKYPHMKPYDVAIWERFIDKYPTAYERVQYDFNVGDPPPFNPFSNEDDDLNQDALYRLKIDVIGHSKGEIDIIEVKPSASASTIGQVKGYKTLYMRDVAPKEKINMVILTDRARPNMAYLCNMEGVKLIEV